MNDVTRLQVENRRLHSDNQHLLTLNQHYISQISQMEVKISELRALAEAYRSENASLKNLQSSSDPSGRPRSSLYSCSLSPRSWRSASPEYVPKLEAALQEAIQYIKTIEATPQNEDLKTTPDSSHELPTSKPPPRPRKKVKRLSRVVAYVPSFRRNAKK